uniref:GIY-YIG domain-containing protein n=1 Tax=viral metagenome TaxID=1070528 RepID=A0A6C0KFN7_9ZZZZ
MIYGVIYRIVNTINSKEYYGQSTQPLKRWSRHKANAKHNITGPLYSAIRMYGIDNFKFEIVCQCQTLQELNSKEEELIKLHNSCCPNGYNIMKGGDNREHSEETRDKIRKTLSGRKCGPPSLERKKNISASLIGHKVSDETKNKLRQASLNMSDETKDKMRQAKLGKKQSHEQIEKKRKKMLEIWALRKSEKKIDNKQE